MAPTSTTSSLDPKLFFRENQITTSSEVIEKVRVLLADNKLDLLVDLDEPNLVSMRGLTPTGQLLAFEDLFSRDPALIYNRPALVSNLLEKQKFRYDVRDVVQESIPDAMVHIIERTKYPYSVSRSQRRYGPASEQLPLTASTVYIGRIPKDVAEDRLIEMFEQVGKIWDLRFLLDSNDGLGRGFCFLTFHTRDEAQRAIEKFDGYEIGEGQQRISVNASNTQLTLYVAGVPRSKKANEIKDEFSKQIEGIVKVDVNPCSTAQNRGYCFVHFASQYDASIGKRLISDERTRAENKFVPGKQSSNLFGHNRFFNRNLTASWAERESDPEAAAKVKSLYVSDLPSDANEDEIREIFSEIPIESVKVFDSYAFVHFESRELAEQALETLRRGDNAEIRGQKVQMNFANPVSDRKRRRQSHRFPALGNPSASSYTPNNHHDQSSNQQQYSMPFAPAVVDYSTNNYQQPNNPYLSGRKRTFPHPPPLCAATNPIGQFPSVPYSAGNGGGGDMKRFRPLAPPHQPQHPQGARVRMGVHWR